MTRAGTDGNVGQPSIAGPVAATVSGWVALCRRVGAVAPEPRLRSAAEALLERWTEPHRRYHNRIHLDRVLGTLRPLAADEGGQTGSGLADLGDLAALAAWYHDAVYEPTRADNEEQSAAVARRQLAQLDVAREIVAEVSRLVLLTKSHEPAQHDLAGALLCDADLAILATPTDVYDAYSAAIRAEYSHVSEQDYRAGRAAVLSTLTARPRLFHTGHGWAAWEQPARGNIARELQELTAP
jgi:predicted metal-dependent HD superfamily phosphohydrolase